VPEANGSLSESSGTPQTSAGVLSEGVPESSGHQVSEANGSLSEGLGRLETRLARLEGAIVGGAIEKISAHFEQISAGLDKKLEGVPSAEEMREVVSKAVEQGIAAAVQGSDGASRDDVVNAVAPVLGRLAQIEASNEALRAENAALREEASKKSRGFFGRLFGG
jgi:hypothetical protein